MQASGASVSGAADMGLHERCEVREAQEQVGRQVLGSEGEIEVFFDSEQQFGHVHRVDTDVEEIGVVLHQVGLDGAAKYGQQTRLQGGGNVVAFGGCGVRRHDGLQMLRQQ